MTIHLIKLSVGPESAQDLKSRQSARLRQLKAEGLKPELIHPTRQWPKRAEELLRGGSIYWVIGGFVVGRQKLLEFRQVTKNGIAHCGIVYDKKFIPVRAQPRRPFQGWRYLTSDDAPDDSFEGENDLPESLRKELHALGLL